jgi:dolichol-phosphate mannosyltransferase
MAGMSNERVGAFRGADGRRGVAVVIPTYLEALSLPGTVQRVRLAVPEADILVVDDASPDGTGELADAMAAQDAAVRVLHRAAKQGLGAAYRAGFEWALGRGYDVVVEMDADGSHQPEELPRLLAALEDDETGLVIGSRWVPGGVVVNWPRRRRLLSRGANSYARLATGLPVRDATAGFRAYRATALRDMPLQDVHSRGYCFQIDMAWRLHRAGWAIREVPTTFVERSQGQSKMSGQIVLEALARVTGWGVRYRCGQLSGLPRRVITSWRGRRASRHA